MDLGVHLSQQHTVSSLVATGALKSDGAISPTSFFFFKIIIDILGPVPIGINVAINMSVSTKSLVGISIGTDIFTVLSLPICEYVHHIFKSSLIYFISIL